MGTASRTLSASRSRSPRGQTDGNGQNIPEMFRAQRGNMAPSRHRPPQTSEETKLSSSLLPPLSDPAATDTVSAPAPAQPYLSIHDLRSIATDIKATLSAAIVDLRIDIHSLSDRIHEVEQVTMKHDQVLRKATRKIDTHTIQLREIQWHVEDLDNRGRRHNLRIRGMPEMVTSEHLSPAVTSLFNDLLNRPPLTQINMERMHRALHPKGRDTDPPRDIICCIVDFKLKEEILRQARSRQQLLHNGHTIQIFQDLSSITLQHRRDLKLLLDILRTRGIQYRWKFPFCLSATHLGRTALLRVPEDLHSFCDTLDIPPVEVPNWYADFHYQATRKQVPHEEPMEAQESRIHGQRSPSSNRRRNPRHNTYRGPSPSDSPQSRRARREY